MIFHIKSIFRFVQETIVSHIFMNKTHLLYLPHYSGRVCIMVRIMVLHWLSVCLSIRLSYVCLSVALFPNNSLSKCQWIFTKLGLFIDIVDIWFGIANGQIFFCLTEISAHHTSLFSFLDDNFS